MYWGPMPGSKYNCVICRAKIMPPLMNGCPCWGVSLPDINVVIKRISCGIYDIYPPPAPPYSPASLPGTFK